ncbi:hypothetical protein [Erwinia sp. JUb26]|uniref:HofO family protein n=1 Tax=Erwinia sp. JUb26 TaxID=2485126 RepID=UPI000F472515|nr:hypothetical protein [Erwinia sp. JUb26]ROR08613.1 hypothetical protein EC836_10541 [Erwinia sp. JUb26]
MSNRWLTNWLAADIRLRMLGIIGAGALMALIMWQFWLRPVQHTSQRLDRQMQEQLSRYRQRLEALRRLPSLAMLEQQSAELSEQFVAQDGPHFSLPALLAASGGELEHWQPDENGGELAITLRWQQFTDLLDYLKTLRPAVSIPAVTLKGQSPWLHLLIQLNYEI